MKNIKKKILGYKTTFYIIKINHKYKCTNKLKINNKYKLFRNKLIKKIKIKKYLLNNKILVQKIYKNNKMIENIKNIINHSITYNYCLYKNKLVLINRNNFFSKHSIMCNKNPCCSGEMVFYKNSLVFNNNSGTYAPTYDDIKILKKALPFLKVKVVDMNSKLNKKYFG